MERKVRLDRITMFCPKCGSKNADDGKFCRGCGADVSSVLAVVEGSGTSSPALAEKHLELFSSGLRWLITGTGLVVVGAIALAISIELAVLTIFALAFGCVFLGTGISRMVQARGIERLRAGRSTEAAPALPSGEREYMQPLRSVYQTDDLAPTPRSVTEHTTRHLKPDAE